MPRLATVTCWVLGALFTVAGLSTVAFGDAENQHHNLLHLATGLVAVVVGLSRDRSAARAFCLTFGAGYVGFGALGIAVGDPATDHLWHVGVLNLATADHIFHLVLGGVVLAAGLLTARGSDLDRVHVHRVVVAGLVAAAAGVVTMALSGVAFTTSIPPGLLILLVPAGLVALGQWRWPLFLATAAALFIVASYVPSGAVILLLDPTAGSGIFVGLWLQFVGAAAAVVAGAVAAARSIRRAPEEAGVSGRAAG